MPLAHARPNLALYMAGVLVLAMAVIGPISQPASYHAFAEQRALFGIAHVGDVLSNAGFLLVAAYGALGMWLTGRREPAQVLFLGALAMTAIGSTWYHLAPDNARLVWDRLPIALACAALVASAMPRPKLVLPVLAVTAALSVWWWVMTGDLRLYLLMQVSPLVLVPLLQWQLQAPMAQRRAFGVAIMLYVLAKLCEMGDQTLFEALGQVSGHTLKHLFAAAAAFVLVHRFGGMR
ncbi:MAG: hypothetical protein V4484_13330 [Pseudomonadota bacterium]